MYEIFKAWQQQFEKLNNNEITVDEYNAWRYKYPELDTTVRRVKVPSKELSDYLVKKLEKQ